MCAFTRARINEVEEEGEGDPPRGVLPHRAQRQWQWGGRSDGEFDSRSPRRPSVGPPRKVSLHEREEEIPCHAGGKIIARAEWGVR